MNLKAVFILIFLISVTSSVSSQGLGGLIGGSGNMSISPFNPIGFTRFIIYMVTLPFRIIAMIFGFGNIGMTGGSGGSQVNSGGGSGGGIASFFISPFVSLNQGIARFVEEIFHFVRVLLDDIFGNLEGGAAYIAGDRGKSQQYRMNRNRTATSS